MVTEYAVELACSLIRTHFGELVQKVCRCLVSKGQVTLQEIVRYTALGNAQIRTCLQVLIQHNCVQAFKVVVESGVANSRTHTKYIALVDNILHRLRFPKFLHVVEQELGTETGQLFYGLLEHGRLTLEQLIQRAARISSKAENEVAQMVKEVFGNLARARYVERCPAPEPILPPKVVAEAPKKGARGSARGRAILTATNQHESEEQRICAAAASLEAERFRLPASIDTNVVKENVKEEGAISGEVGQKRKRDALAMDARTMALVDEKEVLWRVNFDGFVRKFRLQACIAQVGSRFDAGVRAVFSAMLELLKGQENLQAFSQSLGFDAITTAVRATEEGQGLSMERIRGALQMMSAESVGFLSKLGDGKYVIIMKLLVLPFTHPGPDFHKIVDLARKIEMEGIVLQRFGRESCRIFRLLAMKGSLEQKQIADSTLLLVKDARDRLYQLYKEGYVLLQEVPKTADRAPSKTFYLWHVDFRSLVHRVLDDMCHAAFNISQRVVHELEQEKEVIEVAKRQQQAGQTAGATQEILSESHRKRVNKLFRVGLILETSLMKLDDSLLLFKNY